MRTHVCCTAPTRIPSCSDTIAWPPEAVKVEETKRDPESADPPDASARRSVSQGSLCDEGKTVALVETPVAHASRGLSSGSTVAGSLSNLLFSESAAWAVSNLSGLLTKQPSDGCEESPAVAEVHPRYRGSTLPPIVRDAGFTVSATKGDRVSEDMFALSTVSASVPEMVAESPTHWAVRRAHMPYGKILSPSSLPNPTAQDP